MTLDVAVIGCGTAGSAAALFLARAGHRVTAFEAVAKPDAVGAGIMIQPTGMRVLRQLGLLDRIAARGSRIARLHALTTSDRTVLDLAYADVHPRAHGLGLHRGVLFRELFDACQREPGVDVRCGRPIEALRPVGSKHYVVGKEGTEAGPFDLVVVADGARSQLRDDAPLTLRAQSYPWGALWFIAEDPDRRFGHTLFQRVRSTTKMLGLLPSGLGPEGDTPLVSLFWSLRCDAVDAWRARGLEAWKDEVRRHEPRSAPVLEQIEDASQVLFATYWDVVLQPWNTHSVVFLGDAAHATSPQLGQGANLALVDAAALARSLAKVELPLTDRLVAYSESRRRHLAYYQWATRVLTPFFQSDHRWLASGRDALMGWSCKLPYVRTRMIRTMCGLERGVLWPDPLPMPDLIRRPEKEGTRPSVSRSQP